MQVAFRCAGLDDAFDAGKLHRREDWLRADGQDAAARPDDFRIDGVIPGKVCSDPLGDGERTRYNDAVSLCLKDPVAKKRVERRELQS